MTNYRQGAYHRVLVEVLTGIRLPPGAVVHHIDGDHTNNDPSNLIVLQNQREHSLLHRRQRALDACGNPDWVKCDICKEYDDPETGNMYMREFTNGRRGFAARHRKCNAKIQRKYRRKKKDANRNKSKRSR